MAGYKSKADLHGLHMLLLLSGYVCLPWQRMSVCLLILAVQVRDRERVTGVVQHHTSALWHLHSSGCRNKTH